MTWLAYALATVGLWTAWSFLGVIALRSAVPAQATLLYGIATVVVGLASLALSARDAAWSPSALGLAAVSAACGAAGMMTFYLALDSGKAANVVPVIGAYPALVALLSVGFLSERLTAVQAAGVALAVLGVILIGTGG